MARNPWRSFWLVLLYPLVLTGCATYSASVEQMEQEVAAGRPAAALAFLQKRDVAERDRVLYLLDEAMLLRLTGKYRKSNESFESAKKLMDDLSAVSASETATSLLVNDATRSYVGEPFEQALMHTYAALNYIDLHALDEARVEALQVEQRLKQLGEDEGALGQDPFARYLAGMIYEAQGETSDALISYRDAYEAYEAHAKLYGAVVPLALKQDLLRLTAVLGIKDENKKFRKLFGDIKVASPKERAESGELIFLLHRGLAPVKREHTAVIYPPVSEVIVSVALPSYQERPTPAVHARLTLGPVTGETEQVENVNGIANATLQHEMPAITLRAVARAVAKYKMTKEARKSGGGAAGLITNLAGFLTERADTRSWLTLPGEVQMARVLVPPGDYKLRVEMVDGAGVVVGTREYDVHMEKGGKRFLSCHWVGAMATGRMQ
jgi:hypothetical protein